MLKHLVFSLLFISLSYSQTENTLVLQNEKGKIILFGEAHFVQEKYDEMKAFIFEKLENVSSKEKVTIFFELPSSLNYAISRIKEDQDTTLFKEWFNHVYKAKEMKPSFFWTDYRAFILSLLEYAEKKDIQLELKCIDVELEFRRTAFILSSFKTKLNSKMDSLIQKEHIPKSSEIRTTLLNYVNELALISTDPHELEVLKTLQVSLLIDCTICRKRDRFLYDRFKKYYDPTDAIVFGTFGLAHVINKPDFSKVSDFFKMDHKVDTTNHKSMSKFMTTDFNDKIFRVGIIALQHNLRLSDYQKPVDYSGIMNTEERNYIKTLFKDKEVLRLYPYEHKVLSNLASNLDYLIVYKNSNYRY